MSDLNPPGDTGDSETVAVLRRIEPVLARVDERLRTVEATVGRVEEQLRKVENDVSRIDGRMSQLPTALQLIGFVLAVLAIAGATRVFGH